MCFLEPDLIANTLEESIVYFSNAVKLTVYVQCACRLELALVLLGICQE